MAQDKRYVSVTMLGRFLSRLRQIFAPFNHTHNYAGSSTPGGAANSALRLTTPRKINGLSFDGTTDIEVPATYTNYKILQNVDLNTIKKYGFYYAAGGNGCTNVPIGIQGFALEVLRTADGWVCQRLTSFSEITWERQGNNETWTNWEKVYTTKNKPTPNEIGAAYSSHRHNYTEIDNKPTSLKNPYNLTVNVNGTNTIYDGSTAKTIELNPGTINIVNYTMDRC